VRLAACALIHENLSFSILHKSLIESYKVIGFDLIKRSMKGVQ